VGPTGTTGSTGPAGPTGPTGPSGAAGGALNARGVWSAATTYAALDSVSYSGSLYGAVAASTNVTPGTNNAKWNLLGAAQTVTIQNSGTVVAAQNAVNFATPMAAVTNPGQGRIDVSCATCEVNTNKGVASGYAPLDTSAHVPALNLPLIGLANGGTGSSTAIGWLSNLQFQNSAATGSVSITALQKLEETISIEEFGAVCDVYLNPDTPALWTDNSPAIQAALNYFSNAFNSGTVRIPATPYPGGCGVKSQIVVPGGVRLKGDDLFTAGITAINTGNTSTSFPQNTAVVQIGPYYALNAAGNLPANGVSFSPTMRAGLEDLFVNASGLSGSTAVASQTMQENSYLHNVALYNYTKYGLDLQSYGIQNSSADKLYLNCAQSAAADNAIGIHLNWASSRMHFDDMTITGYADTSNNNSVSGTGMLIENNSQVSISHLHCEVQAVCATIDSGSLAHLENLGGVGLPNITNTLVHITNAAGGAIVTNSSTGGSPVNIQDDLLGQTLTDLFIPLHVSAGASGIQNVISSSPSVTNVLQSLKAGSFTTANTLFVPDAGGGTVTETSAPGVMIQKSGLLNGTTPQQGFPMGGMHLIGNGYANDPAWAAISAGATTDLGTFTARAGSANSLLMQDGTINFLADTSLTPGSTYVPTPQIAINPAGLRLYPRTSDPGCTNAAQVGRLWVNTAITPNTLAACLGSGGSFGWVTAQGGSQSAASASSNGYLTSADWTSFNSKAASGTCGANQFETASAGGGPTCAQPSFSNVSGAASKAQQFTTTAYTDQSNTFTSGTQDFSGASHTIPAKVGLLSSMPSSCVAGEVFMASDQAREALKQCNSAGTFQSTSGIVTNGLIADYWMGNCDGTIGSGTVLADCSGNGNSATVPGAGNPTWTQQGLTWATSVNAPVILPTSVLNSFTTVQIYADMSLPNNYNNTAQIQAFLSAGSSIVLWGNVDSATPLCCGLYGAWKGFPATQEINPAVGPNFFTYILDNSSDTICIGANCAVSYYSRGGNNPSTRTGPFLLGGNNVSAQMTGSIYRVIFYNRALTPAEVAQNDGAVNTWVGYKGVARGQYTPQTAPDTLVCIGDSITLGVGATPACSTSMMTSLNDTFQIFNLGMSGEFLSNMVIAAPKFASAINPNGKINVTWIFAGTNDMCVPSNTLTPAQTLQQMMALARYMRSQGTKVMVFPMLSRTGNYQSTTCDALHDQYNALLTQNWPSFADAFVYGMLNDPNLTGDGAYANATYFQADGIHPTTAGQQLIAGYAQAEINGLLTGTTNLAGIREAIATKTANYAATMGDSVLLCNASAGPVTITLPTAAGIPGRSFQVKKTDSSANACSISTTGGQTIDGASTVSLTSQYSSRKMASDNANWQVIQ
jgi:lysophospholipase L1-like esterase